MRFFILILPLFAAAWLAPPRPASAETGQIALVQEDASLRIGSRTVRLQGIYIPFSDRTCDSRFRPVRCGSRAGLALDLRVQGFVYCRYLGRNRDGSYSAVCQADCIKSSGQCREDLGAWLISEGWAVAAPGAPFDYVVRERIARTRGRGIWGFQADSVTFR
jgi:endonuclease YncB( thermonuclease family)